MFYLFNYKKTILNFPKSGISCSAKVLCVPHLYAKE